MNNFKTFTFPDVDYPHEIGNENCKEGWCGNSYPEKCRRCGKGLVHANFGDDSPDGYWLYTRCDACGEPESYFA